jgi:hypothetical protein
MLINTKEELYTIDIVENKRRFDNFNGISFYSKYNRLNDGLNQRLTKWI